MKIGSVDIDKPLCLAPMEDVTELPFRLICRRLEADIVYTEFTSSEGIIRDIPRIMEKIQIAEEERPVAIQIFGGRPEAMAGAAEAIEKLKPDFIDINCGCWVKNHVARNEGAGLLRDLPLFEQIVKATVKGTRLPVTVKTRLGWDEQSIVILDVAKMVEAAGAKALTLHCRTRSQAHSGFADWSWLEKIKKVISIPVIGNGDITCPEDVQSMLETGCDGVMIGRGAIANPWIFKETKYFLEHGEHLPEPSIEEKINVCIEHLKLNVQYKGEKYGVQTFRKHYVGYLKGLPNVAPVRSELMQFMQLEQVVERLQKYGDTLMCPQKRDTLKCPLFKAMKKFDIITIGSGGGAKISSPAASMGLKVAVIEKDRLGGTCLNRGCIPSKMLIHPADVAIEIKEARRFDIHNDPKFNVDFAKLIERISSTVDSDSNKIETSYSNHPNISPYRGTAKFIENKVIEINGEQITADRIFIAVGTRPTIPDIPGLAGTPYMTSTEALRNTSLPSSMIIIGGGYIACELGHAYGALGTKTTFLVRSKLLRAQDTEIAAEFQKVFSHYHDVRLGTIPTKIEYSNNSFIVHYTQDGKNSSVTAQTLLIATGITSNVDTLDLINTGIELLPGNFVKVNEYLETTVPGVFALGDCIGKYFFRHSVNFEGEYLFDYLLGGKAKSPINYPPMPHAVFTHPQVAGIGATEDELKAKGIDYVVGLNPYKSSAMGMALLSDHGFCKILIDRKSRKILGGHIIGPEASDMIHMIIAYMNMNATLDDILRTIYIHPALPEIVRNTARKAKTALDKNVIRI